MKQEREDKEKKKWGKPSLQKLAFKNTYGGGSPHPVFENFSYNNS